MTGSEDEHRAFMNRSLADRDFVYVWIDGVHFNGGQGKIPPSYKVEQRLE